MIMKILLGIVSVCTFFAHTHAMEQQAKPYNNSKEFMNDMSEKVSGELERTKRSVEQLRTDVKNTNLTSNVQDNIDRIEKNLELIKKRYNTSSPKNQTVFWQDRPKTLTKFSSFMDWNDAKKNELTLLSQEVQVLTASPVHARSASVAKPTFSAGTPASPQRMRSPTRAGAQPMTREEIEKQMAATSGVMAPNKPRGGVVYSPPIMVPYEGVRVMPPPSPTSDTK